MSNHPQQVLVAGPLGNLGRAFTAYMKREHPEVRIARLLPFPFSIQALAAELKANNYGYFLNFASLGDNQGSFDDPYAYFDTNVHGVTKQLEMIRKYSPKTRYLNVGTVYENDLDKRSSYVASKCAAREIVQSYRENHGIYAVTATLSNTEYYGRPTSTLARRVTSNVARIARAIKCGESFEPLVLRDVDQRFTWTWAEDVADGMWRMLNQEQFLTHRSMGSIRRVDEPSILSRSILRDYTLVSSVAHTLREFVEAAFSTIDINQILQSRGYSGISFRWDILNGDEIYHLRYGREQPARVGADMDTGWGVMLPMVKTGWKYNVSNESHYTILASTDARRDLNWVPRFDLDDIIREMVAHDLAELEKGEKSPVTFNSA